MKESDMVYDCYNKLKKSNNYKEIILEVPYLSRCIDMILVNQNDEIISIEFKLSNWRQALAQAKDHKLGANKSYICIPEPKKGIPNALKEGLTNYGIGLLYYEKQCNDPFNEIIEPEQDSNKWYQRVKSLQKMINKVSEKPVFSID